MEIRPATTADAGALGELVILMYESMGFDVTDPAADWMVALPRWYERRLADGSIAAFVAEQDGRVIGGCTVWILASLPREGSPDGRRGYVAGMSVRPEWRSRGIARRLLTAGLDWLRAAGADFAELHATKLGQPLYESVGFEETPAFRLRL
ncbi:GNAT family N-acetyltransferase [Fodinicola acaciae]|uniref:GNAT family N-acetyltransferase n=1 Tax=Fodinicola acaciae TaxID=2681555 RepID=UPI0013CF5FAE|nr:GNAT family N-acetyltransferase [Fodinicola acaciae]